MSAYNDDHDDANHDPLFDAEGMQFNWHEIFTRLDGEDPQAELSAAEMARLAYAFGTLFRWIVAPIDLTKPQALNHVGRRCLAAAWTIRPELFGDRESLTTLARRLGFTPPVLSVLTSEFSRRFKVRNANQAHGMNGAQAERLERFRHGHSECDDGESDVTEQEGGEDGE